MTVKKLRKQLAAAIAMTLVATVALGSSTYAWFAMNSTVTATGAQFKTQVQNNLFIASNDGSTKAQEDEFVTTIKNDIDALLEPVSTIDGLTYFYADKNNVVNTGATKKSEWTAYSTGSDAMTLFNTNYGTTGAVGYVDYIYQLKAVSASPVNIYLTDLSLTYGGDSDISGTDANKTPRIAVFAQDITTADAGELTASDLKAIYSASGAVEFTPGNAVKTTTAVDEITKKNEAMNLAVVDPGTTGYNHGTYFKITVRMWLEGEDTTCNNATFAKIDDKWSLDMAWSLADADHTASVTNITASDTATAKTEAYGATITNAAATNIINDTVTYYQTSLTLGGQPVYTIDNASTTSASSRYFTYINGVLKEVTNQFKYTVPVGP